MTTTTEFDAAPPDGLVEEVIALRGGELRVLRPRDAEALIDERAFAHDERLPYWAELWPSGVALARRLDGRALRGARVVELGCGLGLPSLIAARAGGRVVATDWAPEALELLAYNARRNGIELECATVDWRDPEALVRRAPFALVLASDVLYERRNHAPLLELLPRLGRAVWLADPRREFTPEFLERAHESWSVDEQAGERAAVYVMSRR